MPELPDVEALRRAVESECAGRVIKEVRLKEAGGGPREGMFDDLIFEGATEEEVMKALLGRKITGVVRKGKYMWAEMDDDGDGDEGQGQPPLPGKGKGSRTTSKKKHDGTSVKQQAAKGDDPATIKHVLFHMGMTGSLVLRHKAVPQYKAFTVQAESWPPKFCKAELVFEGDVRLAYTDPRRWGRIKLRHDATAEPPISTLAPDALLELPPLNEFVDKVRSSGAPIKAVLLDQEKVVSGVGNWVADEIFFQARIDPAKSSKKLTDEEIAAIHRETFNVCDVACKANAESNKFPVGWLFHHRWANKAKGVKMPDGRSIVFETIGGRTTAIVPSLQRGNKSKAGVEVKKQEEVGGDQVEAHEEKKKAHGDGKLSGGRGRSQGQKKGATKRKVEDFIPGRRKQATEKATEEQKDSERRRSRRRTQ